MNNDNDFIDDIEGRFLTQLAAQERKRQVRRASFSETSERKSQKLVPMRKLLQRLMERGLIVGHCERDAAARRPPQPFQVYENESSESFMPGVSIYFDHPAQVEIAIPNEGDIPLMGVVAIRCATRHPDSAMLQGPFRNMREAALALSDFIAKNTLSIEHDDGSNTK